MTSAMTSASASVEKVVVAIKGSKSNGSRSSSSIELNKPEFDWSQKLTTGMCKCYNYVLQLILISSLGSFLFGFNLSLLNTSLGNISWELWHCDASEITDYFQDSDRKDMWKNCFNMDGLLTPFNDITACQGDDAPKSCGDCVAPSPLSCQRQVLFSAFLSTAVFIGAAVGSMGSGSFLSMGRRYIVLLSLVVFIVGIIFSVVCNAFPELLVARLVCGVGVGIISMVVPTYMSEITPAAKRGSYGVFHQLFITVGIFVAVLLGLPFHNVTFSKIVIDANSVVEEAVEVPTFDMVWWRVMLGLGIIPTILMFWLFVSVYKFDTPCWYVEQGRYADAEMLLRKLYNKEDATEELQIIVKDMEVARKAKENGMSLGKACGQKELRHVIIVGALLSMFQQLGGINAFIASSNALFAQAGLDSSMVTVMSTVMTLLNVLMTFPSIYLIEKLGRKSLLLIGVIGQTIGVGPATICYWAIPDDDVTMWLAIVGVFVFVIFFAVAYGPILWVYLFEIYPTEIKGAAAGLATMLNWVAGILMVFITSLITDNVINYSIFFVMNIISIPIVLLLMKETKGRELGDSPFITNKVVIDV